MSVQLETKTCNENASFSRAMKGKPYRAAADACMCGAFRRRYLIMESRLALFHVRNQKTFR